MKRLIVASSALALVACGGGNDNLEETPTPANSSGPYVTAEEVNLVAGSADKAVLTVFAGNSVNNIVVDVSSEAACFNLAANAATNYSSKASVSCLKEGQVISGFACQAAYRASREGFVNQLKHRDCISLSN